MTVESGPRMLLNSDGSMFGDLDEVGPLLTELGNVIVSDTATKTPRR